MFDPCRIVLAALALASIGGGRPQTVLSPFITSQPAPQTTSVGLTATFSVTASGTAPLSYQWIENGVAVNGATGPSYTTAPASAAGNGATFRVVVTNSAASATSNAASLTVTARVPSSGDWRFRGADLPLGNRLNLIPLASLQKYTLPNFIGSAVNFGLVPGFNCGSTGPGDCMWQFVGFHAPSGTSWPTTVTLSDSLTNLGSNLTTWGGPNGVVTSIDLEPSNQVFAMSSLQGSLPGGFEFASQAVAPDQLQTVATQQGQNSRVITAVSFDASGNIFTVSYGWRRDTKTVYDATVWETTTSDSAAIATELANLASQAYLVTAAGGNATNGLVLVGTRVHGDTLPRPYWFSSPAGPPTPSYSKNNQSIWVYIGGTAPDISVAFAEQ
jgi:hypothetical protein